MTPDRLYELLPTIYRMRDAEQGYPLQALLRVIAEQVAVVEADIAQLYENWFIETCQDWAVPYIGDLVGYQVVHEAGEPSAALTPQAQAHNRILIPRREVANTIRYRRRKGTLALLEQLANDVAGWPARAVEFYTLLAWMQHLNFQHVDRGRTVDLRQGRTLELLDGPFDELAHTVDVRRINSALTHGRYNLPSVGLFVWRLKAYTVTRTQACCVEESGPHCYTFSVLGHDSPLYTQPVPEPTPTHIASEINVPTLIRRRALAEDLARARTDPAVSQYYGVGKSLAIWAGDWPTREAPELVPPSAIIVADLTDWQYEPPLDHIAVDPVLGRIAFPPDQLPRRTHRRDSRGVHVSYTYGFSADIGGGEYHRPLHQTATAQVVQVDSVDKLKEALAPWDADSPKFKRQPPAAVIEITKSGAYTMPFDITLKAGHHLQLRAANRIRPILRLLDYQTELPDALQVVLGAGSQLVLDGLLVMGRPLHVQAAATKPPRNPERVEDAVAENLEPSVEATTGQRNSTCLAEVTIRHCTLVPGWGLGPKCEPKRPAEPSLELYNVRARLCVEHSILGSIQVSEDAVRSEPIPIHISDSIWDATTGEREALGTPGQGWAHAVLTIHRSTVFGVVQVHAIDLAENTIFNDCLHVARRQLGCMRFCYVSPDCRTPRRYHCQPHLVLQATAAIADPAEREEAKVRERARVRPQFTARRYGQPSYGQLALHCAREIQRGADDESELGAFHDLFQPQRAANLRARLQEYSPAETNIGIIFAS